MSDASLDALAQSSVERYAAESARTPLRVRANPPRARASWASGAATIPPEVAQTIGQRVAKLEGWPCSKT